MYNGDDSLGEKRFVLLNSQQQSEMIKRYCSGIEERIRTAAGREEAVALADSACGSFERECPSDMVRRALVRRVHELVDQAWPEA